MAKGKGDKIPPRVRGGGAVGSDEMEKMAEYNLDGAGVDSTVSSVGSDPNDGIGGKRQAGSEL